MAAGDAGSSDPAVVGQPPVCERIEVEARPVTPRMLIVADRSSSMDQTVDATRCPPCFETRWASSVEAMRAVTAATDTRIDYGLMMFPTVGAAPGPDNIICEAGSVSVPPGPAAASAISAAFEGVVPGGATPTAAALGAAKKLLVDDPRTMPDFQYTPAYVLLLNDGEPTCPVADEPSRTFAVLSELRDAGVRSYVVGYGIDATSEAGATMQTMAERGGTQRFYEAQDQAGLLAAMNEIASIVVTCDYALEQAPPRGDEFVRVRIDGNDIALGPDGWTRTEQAIRIEGRSCELLRDGGRHDLEIIVECEPVEII